MTSNFTWVIGGFVFTGIAYAAEPSVQLIYSCLSNQSVVTSVHVTAISTNEINEEDDYLPGYKANYFQFKGEDIGYADNGKSSGIIYSRKIYPIGSATQLLAKRTAPVEINLYLANLSIISEGKNRYLCVSDELDGIGRSGNYQNVRYGYLLSLDKRKTLYFAVDDIRNYKNAQ